MSKTSRVNPLTSDWLQLEGSSIATSDHAITLSIQFGAGKPNEVGQGELPGAFSTEAAGDSLPDPVSGSDRRSSFSAITSTANSSEALSAGNLAAPLPTASIQTQANYLRKGFWDWFGSNPRSFNLGTSGTGAQTQSRTLIYSYYGFWNFVGAGTDSDGLTAGRRTIVDRVLQDIGRTFSITFRHYVSTDAAGDIDLLYKDNDSGAYSDSQLFGSGNTGFYANHRYIDYSWVNIATSWFGSSVADNDYVYQTTYHETLHALGLGHAGAYNGSATYITDSTAATSNNNVYLNDSWEMSIMSYMSQSDNTTIPGTSQNFLISGMAADASALRSYYGGSNFTGNTIYGVGTNITSTDSYMLNRLSTFAATNAFCIVDDGGTDTVNFSNFSVAQRIDLTVSVASSTLTYGNVASDIGGKIRNMTLSAGTIIENAVGGSGIDAITGNQYNNNINGHQGADTIITGLGNDIVTFNFGGGSAATVAGSTAAACDKITDFTYLTDKIDLKLYNANPFIGTDAGVPGSLSRIADRSDTTVSTLATNMFSGLAANSARICRSTGLSNRIFVAVNNSMASYSTTDDLFFEITGISALPAVGAITVSNLFV